MNTFANAIVVVVIVAASLIYFQRENGSIKQLFWGLGSEKTSAVLPSTKQSTPSAKTAETKTISLTPLGLTLEVPLDMLVKTEPSLDPAEAYTFFIQNYTTFNPNSDKNFQMYGIYQTDTAEVTVEEFAKIGSDKENYLYTVETEFNGIKAFDTRHKGERSRYEYILLYRDHLLRIAISEPTDENKEIADKIMETLRVTNPVE
jgi:hypothetical protein